MERVRLNSQKGGRWSSRAEKMLSSYCGISGNNSQGISSSRSVATPWMSH